MVILRRARWTARRHEQGNTKEKHGNISSSRGSGGWGLGGTYTTTSLSSSPNRALRRGCPLPLQRSVCACLPFSFLPVEIELRWFKGHS
jgi:hypothetical protein